jgi:hypothetical protein
VPSAERLAVRRRCVGVVLRILAVGLASFAIGFFYIQGRILKILRTRHSNVCEQLGRPTLLLNNTIANQRRLKAFLGSSDFDSLADAELTKLYLASLRWRRVDRVIVAVFIPSIAVEWFRQ